MFKGRSPFARKVGGGIKELTEMGYMERRGTRCMAISSQEFIPKNEDHLQTNKENVGNPTEKWAKHWNKQFTEKEMANKPLMLIEAGALLYLSSRKCKLKPQCYTITNPQKG